MPKSSLTQIIALLLILAINCACEPGGENQTRSSPTRDKSQSDRNSTSDLSKDDNADNQNRIEQTAIDTQGEVMSINSIFHFTGGPRTFLSKSVEYGAGLSGALKGFYIRPAETLEPGPGILAIHGGTGLNDEFKKMLLWFTAAGYPVLGLNLFGDRLPNSPEESQEMEEAVDRRGENDVMANLSQAADYMINNLSLRSITIIGWGSGGKWALLGSVQLSDRFTGVVNYYGDPLLIEDKIDAITRPILSFHLHQDENIDIARIITLESTIKTKVLPVSFRKLQGVDPGFMEPGRNPNFFKVPPGFSEGAKDDDPIHIATFKETLIWLNKILSTP